MENFNFMVSSLMEQRGMTQKDLAARSGISQGAISKYIQGKQAPKSRELYAISRALGVSMESWFEPYSISPREDVVSIWKTRAEAAEKKLDAVNDALAAILKGAQKLQEAVSR